jgi:ankyrin repeat protein
MDPRQAALMGDVQKIKRLAKADPSSLHQPDENGWHPLHEAVRFGEVEAVQALIEHGGADINQKTYRGDSPLNVALEYLGAKHDLTKWLQDNGAVDTRQEL